MAIFRFADLKDFSQEEEDQIKQISLQYMEKLERFLDSDFTLLFHGKKHEKSGSKVKYSFHARVEDPAIVLASKAFDWDLHTATRKVMEKLLNEAEHKYKKQGLVNKRKQPKMTETYE